MTKHKWANEIIAWAMDADTVECRYLNEDSEWGENKVGIELFGNAYYEFRIKPQPKEKKFLYAYQSANNVVFSISKQVGNQFYLGRIEVQNE